MAWGRARTRRIEDGETAIFGSNETVPHIVRVSAESYDRPRRGDIQGVRALKGTRTRARRVKGGNGLRRQWDAHCQGDQDGCRRRKLESQPSFLEVNFCFHIHGLMCVFLSIVFLEAKMVTLWNHHLQEPEYPTLGRIR